MAMKMLIMTLCLLSLFYSVVSFQCLSPTGSPVDWFIIYKLPILMKSKTPVLKDGKGYYYMDNNHMSWSLSSTGINDTQNNALYNTLQQIYKPAKKFQNSDSYMYAFYNDQPPPSGNAPSKYGHMKGVVGFNNTDGFWLVHSTPNFPPKREEGYSWPFPARRNGQTFICVSYPLKMMNDIGIQLVYDFPKVYDYSFPKQFVTSAPDMAKVLDKKQAKREKPPWKNITNLKSKAGANFTSFAKSSQFRADLYDGFVAPALKESLYVQTWRPDRKANCTGTYQVMNIQQLKFSKENIVFDGTKDHSKWAVSVKSGWTCIGDINRASSQFKRGGGTICINNEAVWKQFHSLIDKKDVCDDITNQRNFK